MNGHTNITANSLTFIAVNAKTYIVGVRAGNEHGWSGWVNSPAIGPHKPEPKPKPKPTPTPTPAPPPALTAERNAGGDSASVSWTAYAGGDFKYYRVIVCDDTQYNGSWCNGTVFKSGAIEDAKSTGPVTVPNLDPTTSYGVILQVWRTGGALKVHATLPGGPSINTPTGLTVTSSGGNLTVSWNAVEGATGYDVESSASLTGDSWQTAHRNTSSTSVTVMDDESNRVERVRVRGRNAAGVGPWAERSRGPSSDWLNVVIQGGASASSAQAQSQLAAPASITVTRDNWIRDEKLHVTWAAVTGAGGYNLACATSSAGEISLTGWSWWHCGSVDSGSTTTLTIDKNAHNRDLTWTRSYAVAVRAVTSDPAEASPWMLSADAHPAFPPYATTISVSRAAGSVSVSWPPLQHAQGYKIYCATYENNAPGAATLCANVTTATVTDGRINATISSWTANSTNYTIDDAKPYALSIITTNAWGESYGTSAPLIRPAITLTVSDIGATAATLTIAHHSGNWYYKANAGPDAACQGPVVGGSEDLTGLAAHASYDYSAYSASGCASADLLATAARFTTLSSVSNLTNAVTGDSDIQRDSSRATAFTTGANPGGYVLKSLTAKLRHKGGISRGSLTVTLHSMQGSSYNKDAQPSSTVLATLTGTPPTSASWTDTDFSCSGSGCRLSANTTYFIMMSNRDGSGIIDVWSWAYTLSGNETKAPANNGWDLQFGHLEQINTWKSWEDWHIAEIAFATNPSLTASNVTATTATLTIANHGGAAWYYKHTNTGATCDGPVAAGTSTKALTGLTANTSYTFSAYSDSTCTTGNRLAAAAAFTTPVVTLTSSNVAETTATLTLANHDGGAWWYDADTGPYSINCNRVNAGTTSVSLAGLTKRTEYVFYAYDAANCGRSDLIATADAFTTTGVVLTVSNLSASGATLGIAGHAAQWWYKANQGPDATCQGPVAANTSAETLTGLTAGDLYTYSAYSAAGCTGTALDSVSFTAAGAYVSNLGETGATNCTVGRGAANTAKACATAFTTGNHGAGYTLASVTARFAAGGGSPGALVVAVHAESGRNTNRPAAAATVTLTGSGSTAAGLQTFTCSGSSCDLDANSTYFVVMTSPSTNRANAYYAWVTTTADGQAIWPANSGWAIANAGLLKTGSGDWSGMSRGATNVFQVAADPKPTPTLTVSNIGITTARITIGGHTAQWWYKADSGPHATCQGPVAAGTFYKDLTGLTAGSFYVYTAYSASGCANASLLASAEVSTAVTVSNLGGANTNVSHSIDQYGQGFTTGNADATLLSATVQFGNAFGNLNATVSLRAAQSNGKPATTDRATLTGTPQKGQQSTFTCADGGSNDCSLDANTKYFIYVSGSSGWLASTDSNTETLQPAGNGWSIEDAMRRRPNFNLRSDGKAMKIEVEAVPHESLTASSVTATGATLTINRHLGAWYYKSTTTGKTTCTSAGSGTSVSVSGLTAGTSYTYSAYSDSTCTTGNLLATAASFTTPVTVSNLSGSDFVYYQVGHYLGVPQEGAQAFTTGSNTGGYTLDSVDISFHTKANNPTNLEVTLHGASGSNPNTSTSLATLSGNSSPSSGTHTFTCSGSGCNLSASTTYFVLLKAPNSSGGNYYNVETTTAGDTQQPSGNGWSFANEARGKLAGTWYTAVGSGGAFKMKVSAVP